MSATLARVEGERLLVPFSRFGLEEYRTFLDCKRLPESRVAFDRVRRTWTVEAPARFAGLLGVEFKDPSREGRGLSGFLWDYQRFIARQALEAKRFAVWADCGLGKTAIFLEWALRVHERTGGRVVILSPLQIISQTMEQAREFFGEGYPIRELGTRNELRDFCLEGGGVGITNYEKMIDGQLDELRLLAGIVCDESSILKTGGGVIKWNVIHSAKGVEYKLSCTATPAPNDVMEYASQAAFLEKIRSEGEVLWTWFTRSKDGEWSVKPHARGAFFRFMAGWSIYLRDPAAYGWKDNVEPLPEPIVMEHEIAMTARQGEMAHRIAVERTGDMFASERMGITERTKLSQIAKGFIYKGQGVARIYSQKPVMVASIAEREAESGLQVLVWTVFDEEAEILRGMMEGENTDLHGLTRTRTDKRQSVEFLSGKTPKGQRQGIIDRFRHGETRILVGKASMLGYGLNFHNCGAMVFSGWNDSFEQFYQAVRRAYRHGQTRRLRVHIPVIRSLEGKVLENVMSKQARFIEETRTMEQCYREAMEGLLTA